MAIVKGSVKDESGTINLPIGRHPTQPHKMAVVEGGKPSITEYRVLERFKNATYIELTLKTGRTHQIRAHLASIKHPVFGDDLYNSKQFLRKEFNNLKTTGQLLQSYYLSFYHPTTNKKMEFKLEENDFSEDFIKALKFLRSNCDEY